VLLGVVVVEEAEADKQHADEPSSVADYSCVALDDWSSAQEPMHLVDRHQPAADTGPSTKEPIYASGGHLAAAEESVVGCMAVVTTTPKV
jgi:hypothetical protein